MYKNYAENSPNISLSRTHGIVVFLSLYVSLSHLSAMCALAQSPQMILPIHILVLVHAHTPFWHCDQMLA